MWNKIDIGLTFDLMVFGCVGIYYKDNVKIIRKLFKKDN